MSSSALVNRSGTQAGAAGSKIRVLFVNPVMWTCGPDRSLFELIRQLDRNRFESYLSFPQDGPAVEKFRPLVKGILFAPGLQWYFKTFNPLRLVGFLMGTLRATVRLVKYVRENQIDVIHGNVDLCLAPGLTGWRTGRPVAIHVRGIGPLSSRLTPYVFRVLDATSDRVICVAKALRKRYLQHVRSSKVEVVYNPVDPTAFRGVSGQEVRQQLGVLPDQLLITTIGTLTPQKGQEIFIRACALVARERSDARFLVIANPTRHDQKSRKAYLALLEGRVRELGLELKLQIVGEQPSVLPHLAATDVFVLPTLGIDGCSRVLLESMAAGKPAVATDVAGNSELVAHGTSGYICPPGDPNAMASAILDLVENPERRARFGLAARERAATLFSARRAAEQMEQIFVSMIAKRTPRAGGALAPSRAQQGSAKR